MIAKVLFIEYDDISLVRTTMRQGFPYHSRAMKWERTNTFSYVISHVWGRERERESVRGKHRGRRLLIRCSNVVGSSEPSSCVFTDLAQYGIEKRGHDRQTDKERGRGERESLYATLNSQVHNSFDARLRDPRAIPSPSFFFLLFLLFANIKYVHYKLHTVCFLRHM